MNVNAEAVDRHLTLVAGLALEVHGRYKEVKQALIRAVDKLGYSPEHLSVYQDWLESRDVVKMALEKYQHYFGANYEHDSAGDDPNR